MTGDWTFNDTDAAIAEDLRPILPRKLFDIHAHLYRTRDLAPLPALAAQGPAAVTADTWRACLSRHVGDGKLAGALFIPYPTKGGDVEAGNRYLVSQLREDGPSRVLIAVTPNSARRAVEELAAHPLVGGFKPYHVFANVPQTFDAAIEEFLPEWVWELAHARCLAITLHLVRARALSDPGNQRAIRAMCAKYPDAKLVLAHAARGFHAPNTLGGLAALDGLDNVWFDTAAICEPAPLMAVIKAFGARRLLWGSDFPVSEQHAKCVTVGDAFSWISPQRIDADPAAPACHPTLVGLESLRAICLAVELLGLSREDIEDIFFNNAVRLLGIGGRSGQPRACEETP